ncbi:hypothetical protein QO207_29410 [Pseudomonas sp. CAN2814]|uniref:hypothetical protein n=1 Tax=Pseudomonas sp. CAN1 TaxID=3046726 RepID=UPI0026481D58|nr:hypothetical protein [Pseudomonas sp. CAN1]MDN6860728.1 hypothetical protein [Pseudomonas sp. CAN1]
MAGTLVVFHDGGQDSLVWKLDQDGVVTRSWPFQTDVWAGTKVLNLDTLKRDGLVKAERNGRPGSAVTPWSLSTRSRRLTCR